MRKSHSFLLSLLLSAMVLVLFLPCYDVHSGDIEKALGIVTRVSASSSVVVIAYKIGKFAEGENVDVYIVGGEKVCSGVVKSVYKDESYISVDTDCFGKVTKGMAIAKSYLAEEIKLMDKSEYASNVETKAEEDIDTKVFSISKLKKNKPPVPFVHGSHKNIICSGCHWEVKKADKEVFHTYCKGCHQKIKVATKCDDCHKK